MGVFDWPWHRIMGEEAWEQGVRQPSFLSGRIEGPVAMGSWEICQGVCQSSGVWFPSRSWMIDMDMCLVLRLHCLRLYEVLTEGNLPHGSQKVRDRQEGVRVPVPFKGTSCVTTFPVTVRAHLQEQVQGRG